MPKKYYRGHNQQHAAFWVDFRELPYEKRFAVFVKFYREIEEAVLTGRCTLRDAGYALEPRSMIKLSMRVLMAAT
jgi:hypothetical protein